MYHQLTNLIRDTVWLKSYLSAVLRVEAEAFGAANIALGSMKAALPAASDIAVTEDLTSSLDVMPDAIPAARSDGMPMPQASLMPGRMAGKGLRLGKEGSNGVESVMTGMTGIMTNSGTSGPHVKDSLYTLDDGGCVPMQGHSNGGGRSGVNPNVASGGYDRYGATDSTFSRNPVPAW